MRFPRLRFTVRRLMIAVAVVAVALGVTIEVQRRARRVRYLRSADACARIARESLDHAVELEEHASWTQRPDVADWCRNRAAEERQQAAQMAAVERWNRLAASRLWPSYAGPPPQTPSTTSGPTPPGVPPSLPGGRAL